MACAICHLVSISPNDSNEYIPFDLGSVEKVRQRSGACKSCRQFMDIYDKASINNHTNPGLQLIANGRYRVFILSVYGDVQSNGCHSLQYIKALGTMGKATRDCSKLDDPYIDVARLRRWLDICDESHRGQCHHLPSWKTVDPLEELLLIDSNRGCLVQRPGGTKYFALSYLWGFIPEILETRVPNVSRLKQTGAFTSKDFGPLIPQTIRDSIRLVRALGERYLWVDRFCIIQDHPAKHTIISRMDAVFANVYCTIIAADGKDADHGIQGVGHPRTGFLQTIDLPHCPLVAKINWNLGFEYYTRGWTYQELHLSPRRLIFTMGTVMWACEALSWEEQICGEPMDGVPRPRLFGLPFSLWPDLDLWEHLVNNYNWRVFSYEEDAHVAFSGVERVVERSFPGGFLYCLPEFFFDLALLWWSQERVSRRAKPSVDNGYCLPSWSWLGWHGKVYAFPGDPNADYVDTGRWIESFRVSPLVDWIHIGPHAGQERTVRNDYHLWRANGERQSVVPTGWKFHTAERGTYYTNVCTPDVRFQYPLPPPTELPLEDEQKTWPPYLRLRTYRAFFHYLALRI